MDLSWTVDEMGPERAICSLSVAPALPDPGLGSGRNWTMWDAGIDGGLTRGALQNRLDGFQTGINPSSVEHHTRRGRTSDLAQPHPGVRKATINSSGVRAVGHTAATGAAAAQPLRRRDGSISASRGAGICDMRFCRR